MSGPATGPGADVSSEVFLVMFGVCSWDYLTSLWFEYRLITRKIRFRWQFVPYFLARYFVLTLSTMSLVSAVAQPPSLSECERANFGNAVLIVGLLSLVFSTWNLLTRTIIIWGHHSLLMKVLFAVGFIHLALAFVVFAIKRHPCNSSPAPFGIAMFGTTTAVMELGILVASLLGIRRASQNGETHLARMLKTQGVAYFILVFCIQLATILITLTPNPYATRIWVAVSGSILSPILSCRLVTSTISQNNYSGQHLEGRMHHVDCFERSGGEAQNHSAGRMTTCIEMDTTKDQGSVC